MLDFLQNLLVFDKEKNEDETLIFTDQDVTHFLTNLQLLFDHHKELLSKNQTIPPFLQHVLEIITLLSDRATEAHQAKQLIALFIPFLSKQHPEEICCNISKIIKNLIKLDDEVSKYIHLLSPSFNVLQNRSERNLLCEIFQQICFVEPSFLAS